MDSLQKIRPKLVRFFSNRQDVAFAYLFGSLARQKPRPLSDIDLAVYLAQGVTGKEFFKKRLEILHGLYHALGTEKIDLILLNECPVGFAYRILKSGLLISERDPVLRIKFCEKTIGTYLDFYPLVSQRNRIVQKKMAEGSYFD